MRRIPKGTHCCRAPGCVVVITTNKLMCPGHWARVPKAQREELAEAFFRWQRAEEFGTVKALRAAQQACIDSLTEAE
jgi:hypothetical protein